MRKLWIGLVLNLGAAIFSAATWQRLPARVASHWDMAGHVNGTTSRGAFVIVMPVMALVLALILVYAPRLDPKRRNFPLHAGAYWLIANAVLALLAIVQVFTVGYNLGWPVHLESVIGAGLGVLFIVLGNVLTLVRPNWIFGVRTPWTLSSDLSWRETHRIAGYGFVLDGLAMLLATVVYPAAVFQVLIVGVIAVALVSIVWSYFAWKRDPNAQGREPS